MSNALVSLLAYLIDRRFGEFKSIKHPVIYIGELIQWFEKRCYKENVLRGLLLVVFMLTVTGGLSFFTAYLFSLLPDLAVILLTAFAASFFLAHTMLYESVKAILSSPDKKAQLSMLVSRDTNTMDESEIYKAGIETYAENLSDGVVAPLLYLLLFGLPGIVIYKTINTMDSMVGYKNSRYKKFGKTAARLDDLSNLVPARLTALMIILFSKNGYKFWGNGHESPNAGQCITAMGLTLGVSLGGPCAYDGKIKEKPYFGLGSKTIQAKDLQKALSYRNTFDAIILTLLSIYLVIQGLL